MELTHLSYLVRDSLEYCHAQINVTQENFERRTAIESALCELGIGSRNDLPLG